MTETTSTAPNGEQFPLPTQHDEAAELQRLQVLTADHRAQGHEIVVVLEKKTLTATYTYDALCLADVIVVDVQCDYFKETLGKSGDMTRIRRIRDRVPGFPAEIAALEESLKVLGEKIQPHCLVLIETTVPPGTTEYVAYPILKKAFERRFPKQLATDPSALSTQHLVLSLYLPTPTSASCPAGSTSPPSATSGGSAAGSTFFFFPGPGIGGYCLPKDGGLGVWSYQTLMGFEGDIFKITPLAIDINDFTASYPEH